MIRLLRANNFRCFDSVEITLSPGFNLVIGPNASGKTSLLEALAYLGRGKSFRGANTATLTRHGEKEFVLFGEVARGDGWAAIGVRNSKDGLEARIDGAATTGAGSLAEALPLQVIDPEVHNLIAGGPEQRRRFVDWIAFHVERDHLDTWRRFRRALKQRNAALRANGALETIRTWNTEFVALSEQLDASRQRALDVTLDSLKEHGSALLQTALDFEYQPGWAKGQALLEVLETGMERDRQFGSTQSGPHRADLKVSSDDRQARKLVSRGQQKLLASAMILAATETTQAVLERPLLLLLDDPAAELDSESLERLLASVARLGCQVVATSLDAGALPLANAPALFHVKHGVVEKAK